MIEVMVLSKEKMKLLSDAEFLKLASDRLKRSEIVDVAKAGVFRALRNQRLYPDSELRPHGVHKWYTVDTLYQAYVEIADEPGTAILVLDRYSRTFDFGELIEPQNLHMTEDMLLHSFLKYMWLFKQTTDPRLLESQIKIPDGNDIYLSTGIPINRLLKPRYEEI